MKQYPSIPHRNQPLYKKYCKGDILWYVFDKLDGSNVRVEWTKKNGFAKFGRRKALLDDSNEFLPESKELILNIYGSPLEGIFKKNNWQKVTAFFEFLGPNSFAGNHTHEPHEVVLFDVRPANKGILSPKDFMKQFGHLKVPTLVHKGPIDSQFIAQVENKELEGITSEGVVCKGPYVKQLGGPAMFKIKTKEWIARLRRVYGGNEKLFASLL